MDTERTDKPIEAREAIGFEERSANGRDVEDSRREEDLAVPDYVMWDFDEGREREARSE